MFWLVSSAFAAPLSSCERVFDTDAVSQAMDAAEAAFAEQDAVVFTESIGAMRARLPCVGDRLDPKVIARTHFVEALGAFLAQDNARVDAALGGLLDTDPEAVLDADLVPDRHPIRLAFEEALQQTTSGPSLYILKPTTGWFEVNGKAVYTVPKEHDAVLQQVDGDGRVVETRQRQGGASLGDWEGVARAIDGTALSEVSRKKDKNLGKRVLFVTGTSVALLATGGLMLLASDSKSKALDPTLPLAECEDYKKQANALSWGWVGTTAATAGLGAAMVILW